MEKKSAIVDRLITVAKLQAVVYQRDVSFANK